MNNSYHNTAHYGSDWDFEVSSNPPTKHKDYFPTLRTRKQGMKSAQSGLTVNSRANHEPTSDPCTSLVGVSAGTGVLLSP